MPPDLLVSHAIMRRIFNLLFRKVTVSDYHFATKLFQSRAAMNKK